MNIKNQLTPKDLAQNFIDACHDTGVSYEDFVEAIVEMVKAIDYAREKHKAVEGRPDGKAH